MRTFLRFLWMALLLVIVALISALTAMRFAIHGREVSVPDLKGKSPAEARRIADQSGLATQVESNYYSPTVPEGKVLSQMPTTGTLVRRDWEIRLAVSLGPQRVTIPQVAGDSERAEHWATRPGAKCYGSRSDSERRFRTGNRARSAGRRQRCFCAENQPTGRGGESPASVCDAEFRRTAAGKRYSDSARCWIFRRQGDDGCWRPESSIPAADERLPCGDRWVSRSAVDLSRVNRDCSGSNSRSEDSRRRSDQFCCEMTQRF